MNFFKHIILLFLLILWHTEVRAELLKSVMDNAPDIPWEIKADEVVYDSVKKVYIAKTGVSISKGSKKLKADYVQFDHINMKALAKGHVIMTAGEDIISGDRMDIDLNDETGIIYNADIFIKENHFYIKGDKIEKTGKDDYTAHKASITSCGGNKPAWKITGKKLDITIEGYGKVKHAALWVRDLPVFYTPFFIFPVKNKRQTGFLSAEFGHSDRKGFGYIQPFFWAINESSDATFYNHYMSKRGDKIGAEYRYVKDEKSKGVVMFDYLDDNKTDDGIGTASKDYGYKSDNALRPNSGRYWFRMKADQAVSPGFNKNMDFTAHLDLDFVSDQDYLNEFQGGYSGFDSTRSAFDTHFAREIDDYTDPVRENSISLNKRIDNYSLNAEMLWYDNVISRRWEEDNTTLHRLPFVSLNSSRQPVYGTPLFWNIDAEYNYFYRIDGEKGHRADIHSEIVRPFDFKNYLSIEPALGIRETLWFTDNDKAHSSDINQDSGINKEADIDKNQHREIFNASVDLSTKVFKVYKFDNKETDNLDHSGLWPEKIRHVIRPQLFYEYVPDKDQDDYPFFDSLDRLEKRNRFTFALVHTLTTKTAKKALPEKGKEYTYNQFCNLRIQQSYDINTNDDLIYDSEYTSIEYDFSNLSTPERGKHLSPLYGKLKIRPARYLSLETDAQWSHLKGKLLTGNTGLSFWDKRGDKAFIEHRYSKDFNDSIYTILNVKLNDNISSFGEYEHNIRDDKNIKTGLGLMYKAHCWSVSFRYFKDQEDQTYGFTVNLKGLGGIGIE